MKELNDLKLTIKLLFYVCFASIFLFPLKGLFAFMENDLTYLGLISDEKAIEALVWMKFGVKFISNIIIFIGGFYMIKSLHFNQIRDLFSKHKIQQYKKIGKTFLIAAAVGSITIWIDFYQGKFASLKSNNDFLFTLYFLMIIGFFFIIFSKVLKAAKSLKEENDLTI